MSNQEFENWEEVRKQFETWTESSSTATNPDPHYYRSEYASQIRKLAERDELFRKHGPSIRFREYEPPRYEAYQAQEEIKYIEPKEYTLKIEDYIDKLHQDVKISKKHLRGWLGGDEPPKTKEEDPAPLEFSEELFFDPEDLDI